MIKPTISLVYNRKKDTRVEVRVNFPSEMKVKYISTGVKTLYWDYKNKTISVLHPEGISQAHKVFEKLEWIKGLLEHHNTTDELKKAIKGKPEPINFCQFMDREIKKAKIVNSTISNHIRTYVFLCKFKSDIGFGEVNYTFAKDFDMFLFSFNLSSNTVYKHFTILNRYVHLAVKMKLIEHSEYLNYKMFEPDKPNGSKDPLTREEVDALISLKPVSNQEYSLIAHFVFACWTGLRVSDLYRVAPCHISSNDRYDKDFLLKIMPLKTIRHKIEVELPLHLLFGGLPSGLIRQYYISETIRHTQHPFFIMIPNANKKLQNLADRAGIKKKVTFHVARHTFLTRIAEKTGNVFTVMKLGGITSIPTAQGYISLAKENFKMDLEKIHW